MRIRAITAVLLVGMGAAAANEGHTALEELAEHDRSEVFTMIIESFGEDCPTVSRSMFVGFDHKRNAYWDIDCLGSGQYRLQIRNESGGPVLLMPCSEVLATTDTRCFLWIEGAQR